MAIDRQYGKVIFICDECGDYNETDKGNFQDALDVLKKDDWLTIKEDDEWLHICPKHTK